MLIALAAVLSYFIGTFPSADLASRLAFGGARSVRAEGSGNPGALNAASVLGKRWGAIVLLADFLKGVAAARLGHALGGDGAMAVASVAVVLEGSRLVGILSERDVVDALARHGAAALADTAQNLMSVPTHVCEPGDAIDALMATMTNERVRHLPVMHGDMVVGMISIGDVVKRRVLQLESDAEQLSSYITSGR